VVRIPPASVGTYDPKIAYQNEEFLVRFLVTLAALARLIYSTRSMPLKPVCGMMRDTIHEQVRCPE
jgi:hypothetical protein